MSWLFSQALVAEYSAATCSDGELSALLSSSQAPQAFLPPAKMTAFSRPSRSGMTFGPLTADRGAGLLTWFLEDSRAKTYRPLEGAPELMAPAPAYGEKWHESSVRYDLGSSSWKTHRCLWEEDLPWSSVTLPSTGMTRNGMCWEPQMSERPTAATDFGLWPTPCAGDANTAAPNQNTSTLGRAVRRAHGTGGLNPIWVEWLMGWPLGWTDLKPLEMARFREWQQGHSSGCPAASEVAA